MSDTGPDIKQKLNTAQELHGVVRTMKAMAASSIGQYEQAVRALADYFQTVQLGLAASLRRLEPPSQPLNVSPPRCPRINAIIFGSDQGLVGQFNDVIVDFALNTLAALPGRPVFWAVGERVSARLESAGVPVRALHAVPTDVRAISSLTTHLQLELDAQASNDDDASLYVFHHRLRTRSAYQPVGTHLLPLDTQWRDNLVKLRWPTKNPPEVLGTAGGTLRALLGEYVFIALFQACAESLASENASRLAAMQRAEKNIDELSEELTRRFHRLRQRSIDEQLFDVVSGSELTINGI